MKRKNKKVTEKKPVSPNMKKFKRIMAIVGKIFVTSMLVMVITGCIVVTTLAVYIMRFVDTDADIDIEKFTLNYTSIVYAKDYSTGKYVESERIWSKENRLWVDLEDIPLHMQQAFIAAEDQRFKDHNGVDMKRTIGAFANMILHFYDSEFGGSTITQQLVKNITQENEHKITRKVQEIFRAINIEKKNSKEQILEAYLNVIPLDQNLNGVQAAANAYFNKDVKDLTLAQCASIAGITQWPSKYGPFRSPENNKKRQKYVLYKMLEQKFISQEEYDAAIAEELVFTKEEFKEEVNSYQSYYVDQVVVDVIDDLVEQKGYDRKYAQSMVNRQGLKIYTPMDVKTQSILEDKYLKQTPFPKVGGAVAPQSAMVVIGLDGQIHGMVGGLGEKKGNLLFNRATQALRQPGSTIKPIAVYGPAIELDVINWSTILSDSPMTIKEGNKTVKWPVNYYSGYKGNMPVEYALQRSVNPIPAKICQMLTPKVSFDYLENKFGVTSLVRSRKVGSNVKSDIDLSPMSLGGLTDGISPLELAAAYQVYANGGYYSKPTSYTRVENSDGEVLLDNTQTPRRVISEETAVIMNKMLQQVVVGTYGTGKGAKISNMPMGGKTGTTNDRKDLWFVGITPYCIAVVWYGYDQPKSLSGISITMPKVWKNVMTDVLKGKSGKTFVDSDKVEKYQYCIETGELATVSCPKVGVGYYKKNNLPNACSKHAHSAVVSRASSSSSRAGSQSQTASSASTSTSSKSGTSSSSTATVPNQ